MSDTTARYLLAIYVHAHETGNSVPPHIDAEARAALAQPEAEPQGLTDEEIEKRFRQWWHDEGSGMPPLPGMDHEEHARRISQIAWHNGAYVARWGRPQ